MKKKTIIIGTLFIVIILTIIAIILFLTNKDSKVTITFDTNGAQLKNAITIDKGTTTNLPGIERDGYDFEGWYTEDGKVFDSNTVVTSDTKLVAKWKEKEDCPIIDGGTSKTVKFDTMGGNSIETISICVTCPPETISLPTPKKSGYEFAGWYDDSQLTKKVEGGRNDVNNATWTRVGCYNYETTIYAKWQKN